MMDINPIDADLKAGKTLNPYQGLKLNADRNFYKCGSLSAGKTLNPYQGLKLGLTR